jgi:hypothetical protein
MGAMDGAGRCDRGHSDRWQRGSAECAGTTATTADAAYAIATSAADASYAAANAHASCSDAHAHATAPEHWICASSSHANAYAPGPSTRSNAHAETTQCFYVACSLAFD